MRTIKRDTYDIAHTTNSPDGAALKAVRNGREKVAQVELKLKQFTITLVYFRLYNIC